MAESLPRPVSSADLAIMRRLGSHKVIGVREAVEARGAAIVYLPPYSLDLNPIEQAFAKLKALLRQIAARTVSRLCDALGDLLDRLTPQECRNYSTNAGYVRRNWNPLSRHCADFIVRHEIAKSAMYAIVVVALAVHRLIDSR